jgi:beta-N-acetylhexosaminidase
VTLDLAPVADVVPPDVGSANQPIAVLRRGYGGDPAAVAAKVGAFVAGMDAAGVDTAVKHFPGLGRVVGNTDVTADVVDRRTRRADPLLAPFAAGIRAGAGWLMIASATYQRIDPSRIATFSPAVLGGMVRDDLGFDGVVVSDDLGAAKAVAAVAPAQRALRFLRAGGDVVLTVDPSVLDEMYGATLAAARADPSFRREVATKARRVLAAKRASGLLRCG